MARFGRAPSVNEYVEMNSVFMFICAISRILRPLVLDSAIAMRLLNKKKISAINECMCEVHEFSTVSLPHGCHIS